MPDILSILIALALSLGFLYFLVNWLLEIRFYQVNKWNFTKDSGRRKLHHRYIRQPMSNRDALFRGYPFMILVLGFFNYKFFSAALLSFFNL